MVFNYSLFYKLWLKNIKINCKRIWELLQCSWWIVYIRPQCLLVNTMCVASSSVSLLLPISGIQNNHTPYLNFCISRDTVIYSINYYSYFRSQYSCLCLWEYFVDRAEVVSFHWIEVINFLDWMLYNHWINS